MAVVGSLTFRVSLAMALALLVALASGGGGPASAADFAVTKTVDTADGICDGDCSLREAIIAANAAPGADTVTLPAGTYTLSIVGTNEDSAVDGDLDITDDLTINGAGAASTIIDGNGGVTGERVVEVDPLAAGITVEMSGVTIRKGNSADVGGGILNWGAATMTLTDSIVDDNVAANTGAGIYHWTGTMTLTNSTVSGNTALYGGGFYNNSMLTLINSTVSGNTAISSQGGGIQTTEEGVLTLLNSTMSGNSATYYGGGIAIFGSTVTFTNTTISDNTAGCDGGGVYSGFPLGEVTIENTIIADNTFGGDCTPPAITYDGDNTAGRDVAIYNHLGSATLTNTIVANGASGGDCYGTITSNGHNLDSDGTCGLGAGELPNTDPSLRPLADNGGLTQTHALLSGSPAVDAGDDAACPATDQRGVARPIDGDGNGTATCDIGAYEYEPPPATPTPTPTPAPSPSPTPAELPPTGGNPGSGGGAWTVAILLLMAGVLGLAGVGSALAARRQRR